jgi:hypothetical protein
VLGIVLKLFVVEKDLLAGRKDKLGAAVAALQYSVCEFHGQASPNRGRTESGHSAERMPVAVPCIRSCSQQGPGPRENTSGDCQSSGFAGRQKLQIAQIHTERRIT